MNRHDTRRQCIAEVMAREGGYVNHPDDRGGPTNYGVTQAVARDHGYQGDMQDYPEASAFAVYDKQYWQRLKLDLVAEVSPELAIQLFDFGVNSGTSRAAKRLQRLLNSLNNRGKHYRDIGVDGGIGTMTLNALKGFHSKRGDHGLEVLTESLNALRIAFCVGITEDNESQEAFAFGWLSRIVSL
ncbi:MAG: glycosyl hydrolase 108 family protein [Bermanella sp.]